MNNNVIRDPGGRRPTGPIAGVRPGLDLDPIMHLIYSEMQGRNLSWPHVEVQSQLGTDVLRMKYIRGPDLRLGEARRVLEKLGFTLEVVPLERGVQ